MFISLHFSTLSKTTLLFSSIFLFYFLSASLIFSLFLSLLFITRYLPSAPTSKTVFFTSYFFSFYVFHPLFSFLLTREFTFQPNDLESSLSTSQKRRKYTNREKNKINKNNQIWYKRQEELLPSNPFFFFSFLFSFSFPGSRRHLYSHGWRVSMHFKPKDALCHLHTAGEEAPVLRRAKDPRQTQGPD